MTNLLTWHRMLDQITAIVRKHGSIATSTAHKLTIISLLEKYQPNESDFRPYILFDTKGYTKNLVREINHADCNVIIMCWDVAQSSAFHAHEGSRCFVKVLAGQLREQQVPYPSKQIDNTRGEKLNPVPGCSDKILNANDVTYIDDSIGLHRVSNMSDTQPAITLHVYMPAYKKCRIFEDIVDDHHNQVFTFSKSKSVDVTFNSSHVESIST